MNTLNQVFDILRQKGYVSTSPLVQLPCMFNGATASDRVSVRKKDLAIVPVTGPFQWISHQAFINSHNELLRGPK